MLSRASISCDHDDDHDHNHDHDHDADYTGDDDDVDDDYDDYDDDDGDDGDDDDDGDDGDDDDDDGPMAPCITTDTPLSREHPKRTPESDISKRSLTFPGAIEHTLKLERTFRVHPDMNQVHFQTFFGHEPDVPEP